MISTVDYASVPGAAAFILLEITVIIATVSGLLSIVLLGFDLGARVGLSPTLWVHLDCVWNCFMCALLCAAAVTGFIITVGALSENAMPLAICIITVFIIIPYVVQASMQYLDIRK